MTGMLEWLKAVRDHPDRPSPPHCHVLTCLVLRVDWRTGKGYASAAELAGDADVGERTVKRATAWARRHGLLAVEKRGHRLGNGSVKATDWLVCLPSKQVSGEWWEDISTGHGGPIDETSRGHGSPVEGISRGQPVHLKGTAGASQGDSRTPPSLPSPSRPSSSTRARGREAADIIRAAFPDATDDEIEIITKDKIANGARSVVAVLDYEIRESVLRLPCDRDGPGKHSSACRDGNPGDCMFGVGRSLPADRDRWCICRCHTEPEPAVPW